MSRLRKSSTVLETARQRLIGLKQISPKPTLAPDLSPEAYETEINAFSVDQDKYNGNLAALDEEINALEAREQRLADLNQRMLAAIKGQFGPDSSEYEQVGGKRRSDRKRTARVAKPKTA